MYDVVLLSCADACQYHPAKKIKKTSIPQNYLPPHHIDKSLFQESHVGVVCSPIQ